MECSTALSLQQPAGDPRTTGTKDRPSIRCSLLISRPHLTVAAPSAARRPRQPQSSATAAHRHRQVSQATQKSEGDRAAAKGTPSTRGYFEGVRDICMDGILRSSPAPLPRWILTIFLLRDPTQAPQRVNNPRRVICVSRQRYGREAQEEEVRPRRRRRWEAPEGFRLLQWQRQRSRGEERLACPVLPTRAVPPRVSAIKTTRHFQDPEEEDPDCGPQLGVGPS